MKTLILACSLLLAATSAQAQGTDPNPNGASAQAYTTLGPAGAGVYRSGTQRDTYGATGNVKPTTGAVGTRNPRY
jgi:hypothetical protein